MREYIKIIVDATKCALCRNKKCEVRYQPNRKKYVRLNGSIFVMSCQKKREKRFKKAISEMEK